MSSLSVGEDARTRTPSPGKDPDAGLKNLDHYHRRLPKWRYRLRQALIPVVRAETPYLARIQELCRTPLLDSYFAVTANLGTHTFFMTALPICFWCGLPRTGVAMVHMLALGVYLSGVVKDALCLPRPLSPPLKRITMSGSAALEYGFPSTHTTNAVSVAIFCLYELHQVRDGLSERTFTSLQTSMYCYALSIMIGRMYCGMHGFFDIVVGIGLGAFITWFRVVFGQAFDYWIMSGSMMRPASAALVCALAVRFHPEPADDCPCFDDSVAFAGVIMGLELGIWHYTKSISGYHQAPLSLDTMYNFDNQDFTKVGARLILGIATVFLWREIMKPLLLRYLPPVYRFVDHWGFRLPRRYFKQSRDYKRVPHIQDDDQVLPPASEIPGMLSNMRHPRKRTVSVGPQSEADVREHIAYREEQRRSSRPSSARPSVVASKPSLRSLRAGMVIPTPSADEIAVATPTAEDVEGSSYLTARPFQRYDSTKNQTLKVTPQAPGLLLTPPPSSDGASDSAAEEERQQDRDMFSHLEKPRVRYDVEVITKLVVYAGIAGLAVEINPLLFKQLGLT